MLLRARHAAMTPDQSIHASADEVEEPPVRPCDHALHVELDDGLRRADGVPRGAAAAVTPWSDGRGDRPNWLHPRRMGREAPMTGSPSFHPRGRRQRPQDATAAVRGYGSECGEWGWSSTPPCRLRRALGRRRLPSRRPMTYGGTVRYCWFGRGAMMRARLWSPEDEKALRGLWPAASREELENELQRSWSAITARALLLALPPPLVRRRRRPKGTTRDAAD